MGDDFASCFYNLSFNMGPFVHVLHCEAVCWAFADITIRRHLVAKDVFNTLAACDVKKLFGDF